MGYDLYFRSSDPNSGISNEQFNSFFLKRRFYELNAGQAFYLNNNTGVYFEFNYGETLDDDPSSELQREAGLLPVSFYLNYFRPHIFGLEAEIELTAFVKHFGFVVSDSQTDGMGEGLYSRNGFLRGYNSGNGKACRIMLQEFGHKAEIAAMASSDLESIWQWNYEANAFKEVLGEKFFVPHIIVLRNNGVLVTAIVWTDAMPIAMPDVDILILNRAKTAPRSWFHKKSDEVFLPRVQAHESFVYFPQKNRSLPYRLLDYDTVPPDLLRLFKSKRPEKTDQYELIAFDKVIDSEYVDNTTVG